MGDTLSLFLELGPGVESDLPDGLRYADRIVSQDEQARLMAAFETLEFAPFDSGGFHRNRRTVAFGSRYNFARGRVEAAATLPDWLHRPRFLAASFDAVEPASLNHALVAEYAPGAGIGWHSDRPEYDKVVGLSFLSPCVLRLRRRVGPGWRRRALPLHPGSAYLLEGPVRDAWQHSIVPGNRLRYSVTFRSMR